MRRGGGEGWRKAAKVLKGVSVSFGFRTGRVGKGLLRCSEGEGFVFNLGSGAEGVLHRSSFSSVLQSLLLFV